MKDLHCRDLDVNCEFVARGDDPEEVVEEAERHVEGVHHIPRTLELDEKMRSLVHDRASEAHLESITRNS